MRKLLALVAVVLFVLFGYNMLTGFAVDWNIDLLGSLLVLPDPYAWIVNGLAVLYVGCSSIRDLVSRNRECKSA